MSEYDDVEQASMVACLYTLVRFKIGEHVETNNREPPHTGYGPGAVSWGNVRTRGEVWGDGVGGRSEG